MNAPALARGVRFRRTPDGRGVLLIPEGVIELNESASAIVELVDGKRTVAAIAHDLCPRYGIELAHMLDDIETLLQRLTAKALLVDADPPASAER